jgi:two-component system, NtrC family, sensor histidine kinase PilS
MSRPVSRTRDTREVIVALSPGNVLRWVYLARVVLVLGVLTGLLVAWREALPEQTYLATLMLLAALVVTGASAWWTELMERAPSRGLLVYQVAFDALLVSGVVHITGGGESTFAWLYILVISEGALLLPLAGGVFMSLMAAILYFAVIVWGHAQPPTGAVLLQLGLFAMVGVATGMLVDRLRKTGAALGEVQSELRRLRLDTGEILATISTGVLTVDEEGHLIYMNPAAETLLGVDSESWEGRPVLEELSRISSEMAQDMRLSLEGAESRERLRAEAKREGENLVLGVSLFLRDEPDEPRAVTAIFQDITDLERVAAMNRRTERLEAVAELSAAMAHEIKNPLASIRSAVEQFTSPSLADEDREILKRMVVRESDRLSRLLTDFLDYSRVGLERVGPLDLAQAARECLTLMEQHPESHARQVRYLLEVPEDGLEVPADADLLHRALFNLLLNATQFSPPGGEVLLAVEDFRGRSLPAGVELLGAARIRVRDQGPGIPAGEVDRIFDPFFTTRPGGTGLGLAVVHRTAQAHQGAVLVERPPRGGTEFQLYFPIPPISRLPAS